MCRSYHRGITTIPKNGMLGVTELSYYFWYDIHTSFFTVHGMQGEQSLAGERLWHGSMREKFVTIAQPRAISSASVLTH